MQFCIIYCEVKESMSDDADSLFYFSIDYSNTGNLKKDIRKSWGTCSSLNDLLDGVGCEVSLYTQFSYDILNSKLTSSNFSNYKLYLLSSLLGLPQNCGLYEVFSYYFDSGDKCLTEIGMLDAILTSILTYKTNIQYSYCVYFTNNNNFSFCWFYIDSKSRIEILGYETLSINNYKTKLFTLGKFIKLLRYKIASSGCCISRIKFLSWSEDTELSRYISDCSTIVKLFCGVKGLDGLDYSNLVTKLSTDIRLSYKFDANEFVSILSQSSRLLGLKALEDGSLLITSQFRKDYSICRSSTIDKTRGKWGIILDCEGNRDNKSGLRELGGIIFCRYRGILLSVETFECNEILLEETLQQTIKNYESDIGRYIPPRGIDILTYGSVDESMIDDSLRAMSSKQFRKKIKRLFKYHDCRDYIYNYLDDKGISFTDKKTLSNVAYNLGVAIIPPKHSALSDSRTLFNILAFILQDSGYWVLDL